MKDSEALRVGYENTVQDFSTAATLDPHWKLLPGLLEQAFQEGTKKRKSGSILAEVLRSASTASTSKMLAICKIAKSQVIRDANKSEMTLKKWFLCSSRISTSIALSFETR